MAYVLLCNIRFRKTSHLIVSSISFFVAFIVFPFFFFATLNIISFSFLCFSGMIKSTVLEIVVSHSRRRCLDRTS
ncbi:hypothetical protein GDO78_011266 [Eleutherodactylus coqui]|uniref:Uncharacterized protein n=1 Tax=Eleutherodactylus coqui TaxID=57060 RepID=A0A8J6F6I3_ELECQ|nr:hypothetical protein GDO78_011266 [Eleutherodactylus coqui]